jgi:hypothetical protein
MIRQTLNAALTARLMIGFMEQEICGLITPKIKIIERCFKYCCNKRVRDLFCLTVEHLGLSVSQMADADIKLYLIFCVDQRNPGT